MAKNVGTDNVFLLTLIDFLLQIIFVGLFAYAAVAAINIKRINVVTTIETRLNGMDDEQIQKILAALAAAPNIGQTIKDQAEIKTLLIKHGVSNLVELSDRLSRMVPLDQVASLKEANQVVASAGGIDTVKLAIASYLNGVGKPHCLYAQDRRNARPLATIIAYDNQIAFENTTVELDKVLSEIGEEYANIAKLNLSQFTRIFSKVSVRYPNCIHSLRFRERTELVYARNAVSATRSFRLNFVPQSAPCFQTSVAWTRAKLALITIGSLNDWLVAHAEHYVYLALAEYVQEFDVGEGAAGAAKRFEVEHCLVSHLTTR